jgi:hypothetical protein
MKAKIYFYCIGVALLLFSVAGGAVWFKKQKVHQLRTTAVSTFYDMKSLEIQIGKREQEAALQSNPILAADLAAKRAEVKSLETKYQNLLKELDVYAKASPEDRIIMRMAHAFGECELNMPRGFPGQVKRHIALWKSTDRLPKALDRARQKGYDRLIARILKDNNLPPQFFFLSLQESSFDERAVGPATPFGRAKGLWQFMAPAAQKYGLRTGRSHGKSGYDQHDERFDPAKSTVAACKYLKWLGLTEAQGSGLLVLAAYNLGEDKILKIFDPLPSNPRERNFWRLLAAKDFPKETSDYVLSIFSSAVICADPKLFGFDCDCPAFGDTDPRSG